MKFNIRLIYLYLFSFVGLIVFVIGCVRLVDLGLKVVVFNNADVYTSYPISPAIPDDKRSREQILAENEQQQKVQLEESKKNRQREISSSLAMIFVGAPLYLYHWSSIQRENGQPKKKR